MPRLGWRPGQRKPEPPERAEGVKVDDGRLPLGEIWRQRERLETKVLGQISSFGGQLVSGPLGLRKEGWS